MSLDDLKNHLFLLLEYDPKKPADLGKCDILKTQRRGEIRYLPFVTTVESIRTAQQ